MLIKEINKIRNVREVTDILEHPQLNCSTKFLRDDADVDETNNMELIKCEMYLQFVSSIGIALHCMFIFNFFLLLISTSFSIADYSVNEQEELNNVRLPIYHVQEGPHSHSPLSFSNVLAQDEARVKALNFRHTKKTHTSISSGQILLGLQKSINIPLHPGLPIGARNFYVRVGIGTPAKYYTMLVDTGSSLSWIQCQPCQFSCHSQVDPLFDPSSSTTFKFLSCATTTCASLKDATLNDPICNPDDDDDICIYSTSYGDKSFSWGYLSQDSLTLSLNPPQTLPTFIYGCGQNNKGLFGQAAGLLGLARHNISMLSQMSPKYGFSFSYCLPTSAAGGGGGSLSIGATSLERIPIYRFTPMITNSWDSSFYYIKLTAITVGGQSLGVDEAQYKVPTIIDSGTLITRLPVAIYVSLRDTFINIMFSNNYKWAPDYSILDTCFKGSLKEMTSVPEIQMMFEGGADLLLGAPNILLEVNKGIICLAFASTSGTNSSMAIIGNHQQQTFDVAYDISNSRIGFAAGGCQ